MFTGTQNAVPGGTGTQNAVPGGTFQQGIQMGQNQLLQLLGLSQQSQTLATHTSVINMQNELAKEQLVEQRKQTQSKKREKSAISSLTDRQVHQMKVLLKPLKGYKLGTKFDANKVEFLMISQKSLRKNNRITFFLTSISGSTQKTIIYANFSCHFFYVSSENLALHLTVTKLTASCKDSLLAFSHHNLILSQRQLLKPISRRCFNPTTTKSGTTFWTK